MGGSARFFFSSPVLVQLLHYLKHTSIFESCGIHTFAMQKKLFFITIKNIRHLCTKV